MGMSLLNMQNLAVEEGSYSMWRACVYVYLWIGIGKSVCWYRHIGIQIRLVLGKFVLVVFKFVCRLRLIALDSIVGNCCWFSMCIVVILHVHYCHYVYCCDLQCNCITLVTGLLSRGQGPEGPVTGHLDAGFSWFSCVHEQMMRWYPRSQVATTCFSCSPPQT